MALEMQGPGRVLQATDHQNPSSIQFNVVRGAQQARPEFQLKLILRAAGLRVIERVNQDITKDTDKFQWITPRPGDSVAKTTTIQCGLV